MMNASLRKSCKIGPIASLICFALLLLVVQGSLAGLYKGTPSLSKDDHFKSSVIIVDHQMNCEQWDSKSVKKPGVIWDQDSGVYKMWFDGSNSLDQVQVGLATSGDGISWTKNYTNPVMSGSPGAWDESGGEYAPFVLKENGTYKMWYEGSRGGVPRQLGYAISTNGVDWFKYAGNPVLQAGPETYDQDVAGHGSVLNEGGTYKLWYHAYGDQGAIIAYATSPDGINWTKQGPTFVPDSGSWDKGLWGPSILKLDNVYWMWYSGSDQPGSAAIGAATSTNGTSWTRVGTNPVITDGGTIGDPHVLYENGIFKTWYTNFKDGVIHYAESDDGITWTLSASNPVLRPGRAFCQLYLPLAVVNP